MPAITAMIEEFQCPGCMSGPGPVDCPNFEIETVGEWGFRCKSHVAGTIISGMGFINLGLPKGFCRMKRPDLPAGTTSWTNIRLHESLATFHPDKFNVPVWAIEKDGYLFVRTYCPRVDQSSVDVIFGGKLSDVPGAVDVGEFIDEID